MPSKRKGDSKDFASKHRFNQPGEEKGSQVEQPDKIDRSVGQ